MQQNINNAYIAGRNPNFEAYNNNPQISAGAQRIEDNTLLKQAGKSKDNPLVLAGGTLGFGAGLLWITNILNNQLRGDYDKTFFGKMEKWGNDIGSKKTVAEAGKKATGLGHWIKNNIINKSEILRSIWTKPSMGGPQVQSQAAGTLGHITNATREYMEFYDKAHGTEVFKDILAKTAKDSHKYADELLDAIKAHPEARDVVMKKPCWWLPRFAVKGNTLGELSNKIRLTQNYKNLKSPLGAKLSGYTFRGLEALSNGMAAGKVAVLLQAFFLAQSLKEGMDAPKGDKLKTFMESMASFMAMMLTMGIQLKAFNAVAGMKFIGMKPEDYKKYHDLINRIKAAGKAGDTATHTALKAELKAIKKASKTKFWQKPFKWAGNILSWGRINETVRPVTTAAKPNAGFFSKLGTSIKNGLKLTPYGAKIGASYVGRFALIATVVMSIFTDTGVKISHMIFGRPKKSILDKEKTEDDTAKKAKETEELQKKLIEQEILRRQALEAQNAINNPKNPNIKYKEGNILSQMKANNGHLPASALGAQTLGSRTLGAQKIDGTEAPEVKRTYIPSPILGPEEEVSPSESRTARIDQIMRQADRAELQAQQFLNGN